jgi:hypothetical protein
MPLQTFGEHYILNMEAEVGSHMQDYIVTWPRRPRSHYKYGILKD